MYYIDNLNVTFSFISDLNRYVKQTRATLCTGNPSRDTLGI